LAVALYHVGQALGGADPAHGENYEANEPGAETPGFFIVSSKRGRSAQKQ
jgi:hypothetical protein